MKTKKQIFDILSKNLLFIQTEYNVKRVGVFGSVIKNKHTPESDVDILIEFNIAVGFVHFLKLENVLQDLLETKVDLVTPKSLKKHIGHIIKNEVQYVN